MPILYKNRYKIYYILIIFNEFELLNKVDDLIIK